MTLTERIKIGVIWSFAEQLAIRGIGIFVTLFLTHILPPEDYGILAMMALFLGLASGLMDLGISEALIRLEIVNEEDLSTAFIMNILFGIVAYVILFFSAPLISYFYNEKILLELLRVTGLVVFINAFMNIQRVIFTRNLNFKVQLKASVPAAVISGLSAVLLAYSNFGVWALVSQLIIPIFIMTVILWFESSWRPVLNFSMASFTRLFMFGYKIYISFVLAIISKNIIIFFIAKSFGVTVVGMYYLVDKIMDALMGQLVYSVQKVSFPALASIQDDNLHLKESYRKIIKIVTFILFPVLMFGVALSGLIFKSFFSEQWWPASTYFQIMCFGFIFYPLHAINLNILKVKGRSDLFLKLELVKVITSVTLLLLALPYGIEAVLWSQVLSSILAYIPNSYYSAVLIDYPLMQQVKDFFPSLALLLIISPVLYVLQEFTVVNSSFMLFYLTIFGSVLYLGASKVLQIKSFEMLLSVLRKKETLPD
ncbi:lipopolysaccharide biosynthesis protein [Acidithiobacillus thiooxidans]|uniref:lipopolysaccharide biosynthesis protein n=1 Tax=Acidithiobacillus thiooxidans TaxID=930 RepID=UPI000262506C|nr:lipopolysaccharide biosynthesis protein [Acidithiobacillus thiooxidans]MBU2811477.1 lipopolysaccharide biosynthesis protein [Acidithiobacillus thiooxidans]